MATKRKVLTGKDLIRRFLVQVIINCELLILTVDDLEKKIEFPDVFVELFQESYRRLI